MTQICAGQCAEHMTPTIASFARAHAPSGSLAAHGVDHRIVHLSVRADQHRTPSATSLVAT